MKFRISLPRIWGFYIAGVGSRRSHRFGWVILVSAAGLLLTGLFELLRHALRARSVVHKVLRQHGRGPARRRAWWVRLLLFPFPWRPPSVIRTGPIFMVRILGNGWTYTDHAMRNLPAQCWRTFMAVAIFLVGTCGRLARCHIISPRAGGRVLITTYRLRPRFGFTEHLADARAVLTWAYENADVHGGDTATVVMAGSSAEEI